MNGVLLAQQEQMTMQTAIGGMTLLQQLISRVHTDPGKVWKVLEF